MSLMELETRVRELRTRPLVLLCRTPTGRVKEMSLEECYCTRSAYIQVLVDPLDLLLATELGRDPGRVELPFQG
jgi:hypothetical protein